MLTSSGLSTPKEGVRLMYLRSRGPAGVRDPYCRDRRANAHLARQGSPVRAGPSGAVLNARLSKSARNAEAAPRQRRGRRAPAKDAERPPHTVHEQDALLAPHAESHPGARRNLEWPPGQPPESMRASAGRSGAGPGTAGLSAARMRVECSPRALCCVLCACQHPSAQPSPLITWPFDARR